MPTIPEDHIRRDFQGKYAPDVEFELKLSEPRGICEGVTAVDEPHPKELLLY
jgi:hypothetical protein